MPSNSDRRPKLPAQRSSHFYYTQLHLQEPHLYPTSNPYSLPSRENWVSYTDLANHKPSKPNPITNTRPTGPTTSPDHAAAPAQKRPSPPSDAALFWSFVSRQIEKQKAKSRAKKEKAARSSASGPTPLPIPIVYPSSTSTAPPPPTSPPEPYSLFRSYRRQQKEKRTRARKALISAPLKGGVTVVRTDSGNEYSFPEPRSEGGVVRVLRSRGGTKRGRGVVMPTAASSRVAGLREVENRAVRRMPSEAAVGLGIDLGGGKLNPGRAKGARTTRWGDFLGKSSEERAAERLNAHAHAGPSPPAAAKTAGDAYGGRHDDNDNDRCRICHERSDATTTTTTESRSSAICTRCQAEYSSPYTAPSPPLLAHAAADAYPFPPVPVSHLKDSRLHPSSSPRSYTPNRTFRASAHPDSLFADSPPPPSNSVKYQLSPFDFESHDATAPSSTTTAATRRGAVSAPSPTVQTHSQRQKQDATFPSAPPFPCDDAYTSRKYGAGRKKEGREEKRRSSFYNFWDDVLAGSRASAGLAARRGHDGL